MSSEEDHKPRPSAEELDRELLSQSVRNSRMPAKRKEIAMKNPKQRDEKRDEKKAVRAFDEEAKDPTLRKMVQVQWRDEFVSEESVPQYAYIGPNNGRVKLFAYCKGSTETYDWVGLYSSQHAGINDYLSYQWVDEMQFGYETKQYIASGLSVRYLRYSNNGYEELYRSRDLDLLAEVDSAAETSLAPGVWISANAKGYAVLNWHSTQPYEYYDWVGLYDASHYIFGFKAFQWATNGTSFETSVEYHPGYQARFFRKIDNQYICLRFSQSVARGYLDLATIYPKLSSNLADTVRIMADQAFKAKISIESILEKNIEPSVFSAYQPWRIRPYPEHLIWSNISFSEVLVIVKQLPPTFYDDVLLVYYKTFQLGLDIADNSERNAKRLVFWQISMTQKFGLFFANAIGKAQEESRLSGETESEDQDFAVYNNVAALKFLAENPKIDPTEAANLLWNSKLLRKYKYPVQSAPTETYVNNCT